MSVVSLMVDRLSLLLVRHTMWDMPGSDMLSRRFAMFLLIVEVSDG